MCVTKPESGGSRDRRGGRGIGNACSMHITLYIDFYILFGFGQYGSSNSLAVMIGPIQLNKSACTSSCTAQILQKKATNYALQYIE